MIAIDSSVIVAALLGWHEHHQAAARALERALGSGSGVVIPSHSLIESYAVMTRLPAPHRLTPVDALQLLQDNFRTLRLASLNSRSVWAVVQRLAAVSLGGGITYDAIILEAASDAGATELLTLNERDYLRLEPTVRIVGV